MSEKHPDVSAGIKDRYVDGDVAPSVFASQPRRKMLDADILLLLVFVDVAWYLLHGKAAVGIDPGEYRSKSIDVIR